MKPNRLVNESSLYLRQHAYNPVAWYPWGEEALAKARSEHKLIFLSIGYSSCHWCHVMERESFEDEQIAAYLNAHFVCIKIDREERPDLDAIYMEAVQLMTGQGGWPLNVWLTPERIPLYGGTYFPPVPTAQRPSFRMVLEQLQHVWETDPARVEKQTRTMLEALQTELAASLKPQPADLALFQAAFESGEASFDDQYGGFGPAPKFPSAMYIGFLFRYYRLTGTTKARDMGVRSLKYMCLGGLYDQIGGGFHRYSTDERWFAPHFEKMLYDNALLLSVLTEAWQLTADPLFMDVITRTVSFLKTEMLHPDGGFYAAIDADSEGREGLYYIWTSLQLQEALGDAFETLHRVCPIDASTLWEGAHILTRPHGGILPEPVIQALLDARSKRIRPATDDKRLTSWNALTLKALCQLYLATGKHEVRALIATTAGFFRNHVFEGTMIRHQAGGNDGFCDDYALTAEAMGSLFQVTGDCIWLDYQQTAVDGLIQRFYDEKSALFFYTKDAQDDVLVRKNDVFDNAVPSGHAAAMAALYSRFRLTGDEKSGILLKAATEALAGLSGRYGLSFGYYLMTAIQGVGPASELILAGDQDNSMLQAQGVLYDPFRLVITGNFDDTETHPFRGKKAVQNKPTAWLCRDYACLAPVHEAESLRQHLEKVPGE